MDEYNQNDGRDVSERAGTLTPPDDSDSPEMPPTGVSMEEQFEYMSSRNAKRLSLPTRGRGSLDRGQVVSAFQDAFELMGGVPRLALWANDNPSEFYRLYSKLLPTQSNQQVGITGAVTIISSIERSVLDGECAEAGVFEPVEEEPCPRGMVEEGVEGELVE